MPQILRTQAALLDATMEDLVHTHNALRDEKLQSFPSLALARSRVAMDILAAEDASGHAGVAPNTRPVAKTVAELGFNPYAEGTMSHALHNAVHEQTPIAPRPKKAELPPESQKPRLVILTVRATNAGKSRLQAGSTRAQVLKFIQDAPGGTITAAALEEHVKQPVRGYLQKLLEKEHITLVETTA